jgi:hypothetical protein
MIKDSDDQSMMLIQTSSIRYHRASSTMIIHEFGTEFFYRVPGMKEETYNELLRESFHSEYMDWSHMSAVRMVKELRSYH